MTRAIVLALALTTTLAASGPSAAQDVRQTRVAYADLNLARPEGRAQFARRIEAAVRQVCGDVDLNNVVDMQIQRSCRQSARAGVGRQVELAIASANTTTQLASR